MKDCTLLLHLILNALINGNPLINCAIYLCEYDHNYLIDQLY